MVTVAWDAVTTMCGGGAETALALYLVVAGLSPTNLAQAARVSPASLTVTLTDPALDPAPGQVLYLRVHAFDEAGNSSEDCHAP